MNSTQNNANGAAGETPAAAPPAQQAPADTPDTGGTGGTDQQQPTPFSITDIINPLDTNYHPQHPQQQSPPPQQQATEYGDYGGGGGGATTSSLHMPLHMTSSTNASASPPPNYVTTRHVPPAVHPQYGQMGGQYGGMGPSAAAAVAATINNPYIQGGAAQTSFHTMPNSAAAASNPPAPYSTGAGAMADISSYNGVPAPTGWSYGAPSNAAPAADPRFGTMQSESDAFGLLVSLC
ncbi:MAG: hypothetical protein AAFP26_13410 [Planctomycetota bacterium]